MPKAPFHSTEFIGTRALAFFVALTSASAFAEDPGALRLRAGEVATSRSTVRLADMVAPLVLAPEFRAARAVIQLDSPITPERRTALENAGVKIGEYVHPNAYVVALDEADSRDLVRLDFVRWQDRFQPEWKLDPQLGTRTFSTPERQEEQRLGRASVLIHLFDGEDPRPVADAVAAIPGAIVGAVERVDGMSVVTASMRWNDTVRLADMPQVKFVEDLPENTERSNLNSRWIAQSNVPGLTPLYTAGLTGLGQIVGVMDSAVNINHCSFADVAPNTPGPSHRKILAYNTTLSSASHGTHVAATLAGDAGVEANTRGVAYQAKIVYDAYGPQDEATITMRLSRHYQQGARVHSNSWGDDSTTHYTGQCRGIDAHVWNNEDSLVLFASTNSSSLKTPENAKNVVAVGATGGAGQQDIVCSGGRGPTNDGRRKPEVFAPGCNTDSALNSTGCGTFAQSGTSMACPVVAGIAVLMRQYFIEGFYPTGSANPSDALTPSAALLKAMLVNASVDMTGVVGYPSNQEGWGRLLADEAMHFAGEERTLWVADVRNAQGLSTGGRFDHALTVGAGQPFEVTLAYTDAPAETFANFATVNDLDLEVIGPGGVLYRGNVVQDGLSQPGGAKDPINTVEVVRFDAPVPGTYLLRVRAAAVNVGTQGFALVATGVVASAHKPLTVTLNTPAFVEPFQPIAVDAEIARGDDTLAPASPTLHYRVGSGLWTSVPLAAIAPELYRATIAAAPCGSSVELLATASGSQSGTVVAPAGGASAPAIITIGTTTVTYSDTMEADTGWVVGDPFDTATASGVWVRGDPVPTALQPDFDRTPGAGTMCWFTGQHVPGQPNGFGDIDMGPTTLTSPLFNADIGGTVTVSYWRWFYGSASAGTEDTFVASISNDDGQTWTTVESVVGGTGGWKRVAFQPALLGITPTNAMRMRFVASDAGIATNAEAAVDDLEVTRIDCINPPQCAGDADGSGAVNFQDITFILTSFGEAVTPGTRGDTDSSGVVGFNDVTRVLANFGVLCN